MPLLPSASFLLHRAFRRRVVPPILISRLLRIRLPLPPFSHGQAGPAAVLLGNASFRSVNHEVTFTLGDRAVKVKCAFAGAGCGFSISSRVSQRFVQNSAWRVKRKVTQRRMIVEPSAMKCTSVNLRTSPGRNDIYVYDIINLS